MITITAKLPDKYKDSLSDMSKIENRSINDIVADKVKSLIAEFEEDREDYDEAMRRLSQNNKTIPFEEVVRDLGLENELEN